MGFEQLKFSPPQSATSQQQSPEKHKLISHSRQEDKKPLTYFNYKKKEPQISLQHILTKFWQPFQPRSNFTGSN